MPYGWTGGFYGA